MDIIWKSTLDNVYECEVARNNTEDYRGWLTITLNGSVIYTEAVKLSYNDLFGPDIDDVALWEEKCIEIIDGRNNQKEE